MLTKTKYKNKKVIVDGILFDSKLEAERYKQLKELEQKGVIKNLQLQKNFELIPKFKKRGKVYRKTSYRADFTYTIVATDETIVEDTKGFKTDVYLLKKKLFEYKFPNLEIKEVQNEKKHSKKYSFRYRR